MHTPFSALARSILSPVLAVTFTVAAASGMLMMAHLGGHAIQEFHETAGIALAVTAVAHLAINIKAFLALFRHRRAIAGCVAAAALAVALFAAGANERDHHGRHAEALETGSGFRMR